ncbi:p6-pol [Arthrobotrys entomopaga]|nr:p6-pol [Arthrobotrys entomopaga]
MKFGEITISATDASTIETVWNDMKKSGEGRDLDGFKDAFFKYVGLCPDSTFPQLQSAFREGGFVYTLVAVKREITPTQVIVDLQGNMENKEYVVTFQTSLKGRRTRIANRENRFPENDEENDQRLFKAGFVQESYVPFCTNCNQRGHGVKACTEERTAGEFEAPIIKCVNCGQEGHRSRDCKEERKKRMNPNACRNCGEEGHESKECTKPRDASSVQCRKCEKMGHFSKDCPDAPKMTCRNCDKEGHRAVECPEPKKGMTCNNCGEEGHKRSDCPNPRKLICNNCDGEGHISRDCDKPRDPTRQKCRNCDIMGHDARSCPKPKDMSRIKCNECNEMGHFSKNCPNKGADDGGYGSKSGGGGGADGGYGSTSNVDTSKPAWLEDEPAASGGGW